MSIAKSELADPFYSPLFEKDLTNLPTTTFIIGEYDGLRSDSEAYYQHVKANNQRTERILLQGQTHNTILLRSIMTDGPDPAKVIADIIKRYD